MLAKLSEILGACTAFTRWQLWCLHCLHRRPTTPWINKNRTSYSCS